MCNIRRVFRILRETSNISADERPVWFGSDGRLIALPNPLARNPARPPAYNSDTQIPDPADYQPELETVYCEPTIPGPDGQPAGTADLPGRVFNTGRKGLTQCQLEVLEYAFYASTRKRTNITYIRWTSRQWCSTTTICSRWSTTWPTS